MRLKDLFFEIDKVELFSNFTGEIKVRCNDITIIVNIRKGNVEFDRIATTPRAQARLTDFLQLTNLKGYYAYLIDGYWEVSQLSNEELERLGDKHDISLPRGLPISRQYIVLNKETMAELQEMLRVMFEQALDSVKQ